MNFLTKPLETAVLACGGQLSNAQIEKISHEAVNLVWPISKDAALKYLFVRLRQHGIYYGMAK